MTNNLLSYIDKKFPKVIAKKHNSIELGADSVESLENITSEIINGLIDSYIEEKNLNYDALIHAIEVDCNKFSSLVETLAYFEDSLEENIKKEIPFITIKNIHKIYKNVHSIAEFEESISYTLSLFKSFTNCLNKEPKLLITYNLSQLLEEIEINSVYDDFELDNEDDVASDFKALVIANRLHVMSK